MRINKYKVIRNFIILYFLISVIGMMFGPVTIKETPVGNYTEQGYNWFIKSCNGSDAVYRYLGL